MKSKILKIILTIILIITLPLVIYSVQKSQELRKKAAPSTSALFSPSTKTVKPGDEFSLDILIDTGSNSVTAAKLQIAYDPEQLEEITLINGQFFPNILTAETKSTGIASITIGAESNTNPAKGSGIAATITFVVKNTASGITHITFSNDTFIGSLQEGSQNVLVNKSPATITIEGTIVNASVTPEISISPSPLPTPSISISFLETPTINNQPTIAIFPTPSNSLPSVSPTLLIPFISLTPTIFPYINTSPPPVTGSSSITVGIMVFGITLLILGIRFFIL
jgi:hypothetical protein